MKTESKIFIGRMQSRLEGSANKSAWALFFVMMLSVTISYEINAQKASSDTVTLAFVNSEPVAMAEFMMQAQKKRSQVISLFRARYGCEYDNNFWTEEFNGETPADFLKQKTLDTLVLIKLQQIAAREFGIVKDISYAGFLENLNSENKRRLQAKSENKVIYGPIQYSEEVYYGYLFSNMVIRLKDSLCLNVLGISDEELESAYMAGRDSLYRIGYCTEIQLVEYTPDQAQVISEIIFNDSVYSPEEEDEFRSMIKATAEKMNTGDCSPVISFRDKQYQVRVVNKKSLGYRDFADCKSSVRSMLTDQRYDRYFDEMKRKALIEMNEELYRQIGF